MSESIQSVIDRAFARGHFYLSLGQVDQADAWYRLAFSLAELVG